MTPKTSLAFAMMALLLGGAASALRAEAPPFKVRAMWVGPGAFASAAAADEMLARCKRAGINLILPNVMAHGAVSFRTEHFHGRVSANAEFDPLANVVAKAHALGIKVQPWCCVYYEGAGRNSRRASSRDWFNISMDGKPFEQTFLSPSNPEVNPYLLSVIKDLLAYDIDGIHLDYIRYPGTAFDYSEAGRRAFKADGGFDPQNFLDHPERIVPPEGEPFPVRVFHPADFAEKVWELTFIERTLDQAGVGFAFLSGQTNLADRLRVPGLLILSSCYDVSPELARQLADYVSRGGNILWTDVPGGALAKSAALRELLGISSAHWLGQRRVALLVSEGSLGLKVPTNAFRTESASQMTVQGAQVVARLESGEPAITVKATGKGRVMVTSFHLMKSSSPAVAKLARAIVTWFAAQSAAGGADQLARKRAEWVKWRGDRVTALVREISQAARESRPSLVVSSSGGPSPYEFFGCYRDAGRWLSEGINDQLFPMNYTPDPAVLAELLDVQSAAAPAGKLGCIYPGLQLYATRVVGGKKVSEPIDAAIVAAELQVLRQHGYTGFCLFAYDYLSDEILDAVRKVSR